MHIEGNRTLSNMMEFNHVIRVHDDGTISEPSGVYAPEVYSEGDGVSVDGVSLPRGVGINPGGWSLLNRYSGQSMYAGPVMHPSEYIGGRMERDILSTPGLYVLVVVEVIDCNESCDPSGKDCNGDHEPAGWAVAYRESAEES